MGTHRFGPKTTVAGTAILGAAVLALAGCGAGKATTGQPVISTSATLVPVAAATATAKDNGSTITLAVGQRLTVRLDSTYWTFEPAAAPLQATGKPVVTQGGPCVPGQGCGTVAANFTGTAPGRTTVTADRTRCGEAMRCVGTAGEYRLTIVVH